MQGHPRQTGQSEEFRQNMFLWRRQWQTTPVFSLQEPMKNMKRQKDKTLEDEPPPGLEGVQYTTGEEWSKLLEMVKNRGAWHAAVQGVRKSRT